MTQGKDVSLLSYDGQTIIRTLVAVENGYVYVCKRREWEEAQAARRVPSCIGFRAEYLLTADKLPS